MGLERISFPDRPAWLAGRQRGIGASEAAAAVGMSPWQTPLELWRLKTGQEGDKDLSGNPAIELGNRMEPALRTMFAALHPEFAVEYHQFDVLFQTERPWLFATLDGELRTGANPSPPAGGGPLSGEMESIPQSAAPTAPFRKGSLDEGLSQREPGAIHQSAVTTARGILEIKTATPSGKAGWEKWSGGNIPDNYYIQTLHQMLATGYDFVYLFAALFSPLSGDVTLREYEIHREDVEDELAWLLRQETEFWNGNVLGGKMPSMPLRL